MSDFNNSKNINTGKVNTKGGDFRVGDDIHNYHFKGAEYEAILKTIKRLERLLELETDDRERLKISQELNEEQQKLEAFKTEVIALADLFQKIALDTERLKLAKQHFDTGEFKEARAILDAEVMTQELDKLLDEKERLQTKQQQNEAHLQDKANEFLILAKLTAIDYELDDWFEKAKEYFEESLRADRNFENLFEFANFLQIHNELNFAETIYLEILTQSPKNLLFRANVLTELALTYRYQQKPKKAEQITKEALPIHKSLTEKFPTSERFRFINELNNLAVILGDQKNFQEAKELLEEIVSLQRSLPFVDLSLFARSLSNLANIYRDLGQFPQAKKSYLEALEIRKTQPLNFTQNLNDLADNYLKLGILAIKVQQLDEARNYCKRSLELYEILATQNEYAYSPQLANALNNLGIFYRKINKLDIALDTLKKSLKIRENLILKSYIAYGPDAIRTLTNIANVYFDDKQFNAAIKNYQNAINIYKKIISDDPHFFLPEIGTVFNALAFLFEKINLPEKALENYNAALNLYQKLNTTIPLVYLSDLTITQINLALFYQNSQSNQELSLQYINKAFHSLQQLKQSPFYQDYRQMTLQILQAWNIDPEQYLKEQFGE